MRCEAYFFVIAKAITKKYNDDRLFIIFVTNRFPELFKILCQILLHYPDSASKIFLVFIKL